MINAELFSQTFDIYATELWAMPEQDFLKWLNAESITKKAEMDLISRKALKDKFEWYVDEEVMHPDYIRKEHAFRMIKEAPSIQSIPLETVEKIREEIKSHELDPNDVDQFGRGVNFGIGYALGIIDKYTEGKE